MLLLSVSQNMSLLSRQYCQAQRDRFRPAGQFTYLKVRLVQFLIVSNAHSVISRIQSHLSV